MADINYCPGCGHKTENAAAFCVQCGDRLPGSNGFSLMPWFFAAGTSLALLALIKFVILPKPAAQEAEHTHVAEHTHEDTPEIAALKEQAANGDVAALMALSEAQLHRSSEDGHYLLDAAATLERIVLSYPDHGYALRLLGNIYFELARTDRTYAHDAIKQYSAYLELYPEDANVHTDLGTVMLGLGRDTEAIEQYEKALSIFPDFYNALYNMSRAYAHMGDSGKEAEFKEKAAEVDSRVGKQLAPRKDLPRLPESSGEGAATRIQTTSVVSEGIDYSSIQTFFKTHPIIGPKLASFRAEDGIAIAELNQFPMDKMPPMVRDSLEKKIVAALTPLGEKARLELRDAADKHVMATYQP